MRDNQIDLNNGKHGHESIPGAMTLAGTAALENFVRLQQSQAEFMAWLDACEKQASVDRYNYRKIR